MNVETAALDEAKLGALATLVHSGPCATWCRAVLALPSTDQLSLARDDGPVVQCERSL
jgi:hypothetical protein